MTTRARIAGGDAGSPAWALADIDGQLYKREVDAGHETWAPVAAVAEADGLSFLHAYPVNTTTKATKEKNE